MPDELTPTEQQAQAILSTPLKESKIGFGGTQEYNQQLLASQENARNVLAQIDSLRLQRDAQAQAAADINFFAEQAAAGDVSGLINLRERGVDINSPLYRQAAKARANVHFERSDMLAQIEARQAAAQQPTPAEIAKQMSLIPSERYKSVVPTPQEIQRQMSIVPELRNQPVIRSAIPIQLQPSPIMREDLRAQSNALSSAPYLQAAFFGSNPQAVAYVKQKVPDYSADIAGNITQTALYPLVPEYRNPAVSFSRGAARGVSKESIEHPIRTGVPFVVGGLLGGGLRLGALGLKTAGASMGTLAFIEDTAFVSAATLGTKYLYDVSKETASAPTAEKKGAVVGIALKDAALFGYGSKLGGVASLKALDIFRTLRAKELRTTDIVAPEYFKGQEFPKIKKGQTAGELLKEFYQASLPNEKTGARIFHATGFPFAKETKTSKGSSEFFGLYGAPKLSPHFLRVSGEKTLLQTRGYLSTGLPTALRVKLPSLELGKGVTASTHTFVSITKALKKFYAESIAGTGKAFLPFVKPEKEAVLAYQTPIIKTAQRFYFKFGGRRVPIAEYSVDLGKVVRTKSPKTKVETFESITKKLSSSYKGKQGVFTPIELLAVASSYRKTSSSRTQPLSSVAYLSGSKSGLLPSSVRAPPSSHKAPPRYTYIPRLSPPRLPPMSPPASPPRSPPMSPPLLPPVSPPKSPPKSPPLYPPSPPLYPPTRRPPRMAPPSSHKDLRSAAYTVLVRRRGKFKPLTVKLPYGRALYVGQREARRTLGATFRLIKTGEFTRTPDIRADLDIKQFRKPLLKSKLNKPLTFIQRSGKRLSSLTERRDIQMAKQLRKALRF